MLLTGILLAGGKSSRMGNDKGWIPYKGKILAGYSLELLRKYCGEIVISSNNPAYSRFGRVIQDNEPGKGPLSGLVSAIGESHTDWNLVLACDMPNVNEALVELILANASGNLGVVPMHDEFLEPVSALYHRDAAPVFAKEMSDGNLSLLNILRTNPFVLADTKPLLEKFPLLFTNINLPEDLTE